jgi:hypothetical protein
VPPEERDKKFHSARRVVISEPPVAPASALAPTPPLLSPKSALKKPHDRENLQPQTPSQPLEASRKHREASDEARLCFPFVFELR